MQYRVLDAANILINGKPFFRNCAIKWLIGWLACKADEIPAGIDKGVQRIGLAARGLITFGAIDFAPCGMPVEWVSGCAWLVRGDAVRAAGPLCEEYFMYWEDVDYCRLLHDAGWLVLATPDVTVLHNAGTGSTGTALLPADGGLGLLRYFARFHPDVPPAAVRHVMRVSAALRHRGHAWRARHGNARSTMLARRYALTLDLLRQSAAHAAVTAHTQSEDA